FRSPSGRTARKTEYHPHENDTPLARVLSGWSGFRTGDAERVPNVGGGHDFAVGPLSGASTAVYSTVAAVPAASRIGWPGSGGGGGHSGTARRAIAAATAGAVAQRFRVAATSFG